MENQQQQKNDNIYINVADRKPYPFFLFLHKIKMKQFIYLS